MFGGGGVMQIKMLGGCTKEGNETLEAAGKVRVCVCVCVRVREG